MLGGGFGVSTALGLGFAAWLGWFIAIVAAATSPENPWKLLMDFNAFGEGPVELVLTLGLAAYSLTVLVLYNQD